MLPIKYTYVGDIDIELTDDDVQAICISGNNDTPVANVVQYDYVKKQLANISDDDLLENVSQAVGDPLEDKSRTSLENYLVWLAAWNIAEGQCFDVDVA